jgi:sulfur carrier protein ThiS
MQRISRIATRLSFAFLFFIFTNSALYAANTPPPIPVDRLNVCAVAGSSLLFSGSTTSSKKAAATVEAVKFEMKKQVIAYDRSKSNPYKLTVQMKDTCPLTRYYIAGLSAYGEEVWSQKGNMEVVVKNRAPVSIEKVEIRDLKNAVIKLSGNLSLEDAKVFLLDNSNNKLTDLTVSYDASQREVTANIKDLAIADYTIWAVGYTSDCQYIPSPALLQVPERIKITVSGKKVDVTQSHILNIELATVGLEDNEVEIKLDGAIVSKTKASSKAVELDLTDVRTGEHQLQAYSKISDVELTSLPLAVSVDNPDFEKRLTEKKKESNRESTVAAARKLYDALYDHSGKVGHIRGLAVVEGASVVFGDALPISLVMRKSKEKGEGEIWVDNELDVYTKESIASALLFAQNYLRKHGVKFDIWDYDYLFTFDEPGSIIEGNSAGAAIATLVISRMTNKPIRSEIAITGAVSPEGEIGDVGGYSDKSLAAFKNPRVLTLIIPRTIDALVETLSLPDEFIAGHRIIAVDNMEQVLRQALVNYDLKANKSDEYLRSALNCYVSNDIVNCSQALQKVYELTPEDLSYKFWWYRLLKDR